MFRVFIGISNHHLNPKTSSSVLSTFRSLWPTLLVLCLFLVGNAKCHLASGPPLPENMPDTINVRGKEVNLGKLKNPLRSKPAEQMVQSLHEGGNIYFKNCFLCHGDLLDGKGIFGESFFPRPADFTHPKSILSKPESYAYWRIMKGGRGLPDKLKPWESAMPAWENQLSEEKVWKVILFLYETAGEMARPSTPGDSEPSLAAGEEIYREKCAYCHGKTGKGDGPAAAFSSPKPRNFTKGHIKFRSVKFGKIPTDQDLFDIISKGMPGTTMPSWAHLSESNRWSLVLYLKTLSKKFEKAKKKGRFPKVIPIPDPPAEITLESIASGKEFFLINCSGCHGVKGRSDGASTHKVVDIPTDSIWPRNLGKSWTFRRESSRKNMFQTVRTGLSGTAMPRFSSRVFTDEQIWDVVHYVQTLSPAMKPEIRRQIKVKRIEGDLPLDPEDELWKSMDSYFFPFGRQIIEAEKAPLPSIDGITVKAVYNNEEIAIYAHWDDPRPDPILSTLTRVEESPAPPLPPHLQTGEEDDETDEGPPVPQPLPDSVAIQFPVHLNPDGSKPFFLNGDSEHPVNLWKWDSNPLQAVDMNANGVTQWTMQTEASQDLSSKVMYRFGRYFLVIKRKLGTADKQHDIQFEPGKAIPVAFNAWDGSQGDTGSKKSVSSWFSMILE